MKIKLSIFTFILLSLPAFSQFDFIPSVTEGCNFVKVNFDIDTLNFDESLISDIYWDFGNGETSTSKFPDSVDYAIPQPIDFFDSTIVFPVSVYYNNDTTTRVTKDIIVHKVFIPEFTIQTLNEFSAALNPEIEQWTDPNSDYSFTWDINTGHSHTDVLPNYIYEFPSAGSYSITLTVSDDFGCADSRTKTYEIDEEYYFPNILYTESDNPIFYQYDGVTPIRFQVFSRHGVKVYESNAPSIYWDGKNQSGDILNQGVYFYIIESENKEPVFKSNGFIHIFHPN